MIVRMIYSFYHTNTVMCSLYLLNELPNWSVSGYICMGKGNIDQTIIARQTLDGKEGLPWTMRISIGNHT